MPIDDKNTRLSKKNLALTMGVLNDRFTPSIEIGSLLAISNQGTLPTDTFAVAGRMMLRRDFGKCIFIVLIQGEYELQVLLKNEHLDLNSFDNFKKLCDIGDIIGVEGALGRSRSGDLVLIAQTLKLVTKCLALIPNKQEIQDRQVKYRQRFLDLLVNKDSYNIFLQRTKTIVSIRKFMTQKGFIEVETPMMHNIASGASAKPFVTFHEALNIKLFMRIAPELYLKRLQVGNFPKVFEINKNFRNEGISPQHNPEFTMLEWYEAYGNYQKGIDMTKDLMSHLAQELALPSEHVLWRSIAQDTMLNITAAHLNFSPQDLTSPTRLRDLVAANNVPHTATDSVGMLLYQLFDHLVTKAIMQPTFVTDYPVEISPLAKISNTNPGFTERAEMFVHGMELVNLYSELNDPEEQSARLKMQHEVLYDEDYVECLNYGMPPCVGVGIGIDRLVLLITGAKHLKDVILFPTLKPDK